jgi:monoamine oxidase
MHRRSVAIIGGGPGGLFTAWQLERTANLPLDLHLYEATGRLGGKVLTPRFDSMPARYEAGAAEFYDYSVVDEDPLREAVRLLGLPTQELGGSAVLLDGRVLGTLDDVAIQLGPQAHAAVEAFDRRAKATQSPRQLYASGFDGAGSSFPGFVGSGVEAPRPGARRFDAEMNAVGCATARRYLETMIRSDLATEPARTSVDYGLQNYLMNDPAYMRLYCLADGNERLVEALAARIGGHVRLGEPVTAIGRDAAGRLRVESRDAAGLREAAFDLVIVALPMAHLGSIRFEGTRLAAALAAHRAHHDHPAHYLRITILFDRPFWRRHVSDAFFMLDRFGGCCLYDESAREPGATHGVLGWLLAGTEAAALCDRTDDELVELALASLPPFLGDGRGAFREGRVHRWAGAVSALPGGEPGLPLDRRHCPEPIEHPDLFLVGDYLFDSTLNGVLDSATYVAGWAAARLADAAENGSPPPPMPCGDSS